MITLVIATRNTHKVGEIRGVLSDAFEYRTLNDISGAPAVVEDATTFAGNAMKKSVQLARWIARQPASGLAPICSSTCNELYCLADDSGLEVDALDGAPGVHSARFAALGSSTTGNSSDAANNAKLLRLLEGIPAEQRTARFRCVIAVSPVVWPEREASSRVCETDEGELRTELFDGICEGSIDVAPRGTQGFGYDPLFVPAGFRESFGELGSDVKNRISHRAKALEKAREWFQRLSM